MHGVSKRRTWRKLHMGANPEDGEIQAVILTENSVSDDAAVEVLLEQIEQAIAKFAADGAYDKRKVYDCLNTHSPDVNILIPPRKNARIWKHGNTKAERLKRDENLRSIRKHGRKEWKKNSGYHVRSLAETIMFRLKTIFGDELVAGIEHGKPIQYYPAEVNHEWAIHHAKRKGLPPPESFWGPVHELFRDK